VQGQYRISSEPGETLSTILGSCVACCLRDPHLGLGGMNHFLLPGEGATANSVSYGVNAMELLINGLLSRGAQRERLQAKLFGGAQVVKGLGDIGSQNAVFAQDFLKSEGIPCVGQSLGGSRARRLRYWPVSGRASQLLLTDPGEAIFRAERSHTAPSQPVGNVEFFS